MNRNVNVFIAVVLCMGLCGGLIWLHTANDGKLGWNIQDLYGDSGSSSGVAYTNATFSGSADGGSLSMPVMSSRSLRRSATSHVGVSSQPIANSLSPLTSSPLTSSPTAGGAMYATSSQTFKSFGSGNGGAVVGGGMRGGATMSNSSSPITYVSSGVGSFSTLPFSEGVGSSTSLPFRDGSGLGMSGDGSYAAAPAHSSSLFGAYGDIYASTTVGSYNPMSSVYGGHGYAGVSDPQRVVGNPGGNPYTSWLIWIAAYMNGQEGNIFNFNEEDAWAAYLQWYSDTYGIEYGTGGGPQPEISWDMWLQLFKSHGGSHNYNGKTYNFVPVGDILPLLLLALMYIAFILSKSLKSIKENK